MFLINLQDRAVILLRIDRILLIWQNLKKEREKKGREALFFSIFGYYCKNWLLN